LKRLASILLIGLLLFNWIGYRLYSHYLEQHSDLQLEVSLDNNNFNEADLFELRVPLNLPYTTDWQDFERFNGEIEINGIHYKYVKRKVVDGELVLLCVPNESKMEIQSSRDQFFQLVNDLNHNTGSKENPSGKTSSSKSLSIDYMPEGNNWSVSMACTNASTYTYTSIGDHTAPYLTSPAQPPEVAC
jgi:hypothetical protein